MDGDGNLKIQMDIKTKIEESGARNCISLKYGLQIRVPDQGHISGIKNKAGER